MIQSLIIAFNNICFILNCSIDLHKFSLPIIAFPQQLIIILVVLYHSIQYINDSILVDLQFIQLEQNAIIIQLRVILYTFIFHILFDSTFILTDFLSSHPQTLYIAFTEIIFKQIIGFLSSILFQQLHPFQWIRQHRSFEFHVQIQIFNTVH